MGFFGKLNRLFFPGSATYEPLGAGKKIALGFQHAFAMSCATILVPLLTGLDVGVALLCAGIGTLIFHSAPGQEPLCLGSSFAFIAAIQGIVGNPSFGETKKDQISVAMGHHRRGRGSTSSSRCWCACSASGSSTGCSRPSCAAWASCSSV